MKLRLRTYTTYSIGCAITWSVILAVVAAKGNERQKRDFLLASVTWWSGWTSATIARAVYPPPKPRSLRSPPPQA